MFKRALQAHHWMAIGIDKWNELENMDISLSRVRTMRKLKETDSDDDSDCEDEEVLEEEVDESVDDEEQSGSSASSDSGSGVEGPDDAESCDEEAKESVGTFRFCEHCPGRKFLTDRDMESHLASAKHLKRVSAQAAAAVTPTTPVNSEEPVQPKSKKIKPSEPRVEKSIPKVQNSKKGEKMNRKARRAHLAKPAPESV